MTWSTLLQNIQWISFLALTVTPSLALYGILTTPWNTKTAVWSFIYYFMTGLGITAGQYLPPQDALPVLSERGGGVARRSMSASLGETSPLTSPSFSDLACVGYHRLWAHRSYNAAPALQYVLAMWGTGAVQGSIKWWSRGHRAHHRYTDTELDPYNAHEGQTESSPTPLVRP